jgi:ATP-dependent DNA ligase
MMRPSFKAAFRRPARKWAHEIKHDGYRHDRRQRQVTIR